MRNLIKYELDEKKKQRCISQMSTRKQIRYQYEQRISLLKEEHEHVLSDLIQLQNKQEAVYHHVSGILQERDSTLKNFDQLIILK